MEIECLALIAAFSTWNGTGVFYGFECCTNKTTFNLWKCDEIGRRAVSTLKEMCRMGELGGHTTNISSRILYI